MRPEAPAFTPIAEAWGNLTRWWFTASTEVARATLRDSIQCRCPWSTIRGTQCAVMLAVSDLPPGAPPVCRDCLDHFGPNPFCGCQCYECDERPSTPPVGSTGSSGPGEDDSDDRSNVTLYVEPDHAVTLACGWAASSLPRSGSAWATNGARLAVDLAGAPRAGGAGAVDLRAADDWVPCRCVYAELQGRGCANWAWVHWEPQTCWPCWGEARLDNPWCGCRCRACRCEGSAATALVVHFDAQGSRQRLFSQAVALMTEDELPGGFDLGLLKSMLRVGGTPEQIHLEWVTIRGRAVRHSFRMDPQGLLPWSDVCAEAMHKLDGAAEGRLSGIQNADYEQGSFPSPWAVFEGQLLHDMIAYVHRLGCA